MADEPDLAGVAAPSGSGAGTATIVVGFDGSETSWDALWWACGEARRLDGRLVAVLVTPSVEMAAGVACAMGVDDGHCMAAADEAADDRAERLRAEVQRRTAGERIVVGFLHAFGDAARELESVAGALHADAIAVGRSTKLHHRLAGSLGRRLLARRRVPIVVVVP
jgi:nucleotide-binding universal stress UspA family protein